MWVVFIHHPLQFGVQMSQRYFKKPTGIIIIDQSQHDIKSLEDRFEECDVDGNAIKKVAKKKTAKKGSKK